MYRVVYASTLLPFPLAGAGQRIQGASYLGAGPGTACWAGRGGDRAASLPAPTQAASLGLEPAQGQPRATPPSLYVLVQAIKGPHLHVSH